MSRYHHHRIYLLRADATTHLENVEAICGALVWPLQGLLKQDEKHRADGYDGFNQVLKMRIESRA
ncbi:MAG: hypothetical protein JWQ22_1622 [Devosia sp.]|nr:hypothetical protein [Devosia sp.]